MISMQYHWAAIVEILQKVWLDIHTGIFFCFLQVKLKFLWLSNKKYFPSVPMTHLRNNLLKTEMKHMRMNSQTRYFSGYSSKYYSVTESHIQLMKHGPHTRCTNFVKVCAGTCCTLWNIHNPCSCSLLQYCFCAAFLQWTMNSPVRVCVCVCALMLITLRNSWRSMQWLYLDHKVLNSHDAIRNSEIQRHARQKGTAHVLKPSLVGLIFPFIVLFCFICSWFASAIL